MNSPHRKSYPTKDKLKFVKLLDCGLTASQIQAEYGIHSNNIMRWARCRQALVASPNDKRKLGSVKKALYPEIIYIFFV